MLDASSREFTCFILSLFGSELLISPFSFVSHRGFEERKCLSEEEVDEVVEEVEDLTDVEEAEVVEDLDAVVVVDLDAVVVEVVLTDSKTLVLQIMLLVRSSVQIKISHNENMLQNSRYPCQ